MLLDEITRAYDLIDSSEADGESVVQAWESRNKDVIAETETVKGEDGSTDFVKLRVPGSKGKISGGDAPTIGVVGRLGGVGARPSAIGAVSDADGAIVAISLGLKLAKMVSRGDGLPGDVIVSTHVCPISPVQPHDPVDFMGSPVDMKTMNDLEIDEAMDAILSIDATKGNRIINERGFAISPTVKEGYILRPSEDLLRIMGLVTGQSPVTFPLTTQDITPYGNGLHHINSILQPATATNSPVVGVATTSGAVVPGIGTGVNYPLELEAATRFCLEVAKEFTLESCDFYSREEYDRLVELYGSMEKFQTLGN